MYAYSTVTKPCVTLTSGDDPSDYYWRVHVIICVNEFVSSLCRDPRDSVLASWDPRASLSDIRGVLVCGESFRSTVGFRRFEVGVFLPPEVDIRRTLRRRGVCVPVGYLSGSNLCPKLARRRRDVMVPLVGLDTDPARRRVCCPGDRVTRPRSTIGDFAGDVGAPPRTQDISSGAGG